MRRKANRVGKRAHRPKLRLGLPDLDQAKAGVLNSLRSPESQRGYRHSIEEFIAWYCSEPRLSFNKTVVTRYRIHLETRQLAPGTINVRLAAVRRLAYEAADAGLLSPELAAGIRRVKGARKLGVRLGNWLPIDGHSARMTLRQGGPPVSAVVDIDDEGKLTCIRGIDIVTLAERPTRRLGIVANVVIPRTLPATYAPSGSKSVSLK